VLVIVGVLVAAAAFPVFVRYRVARGVPTLGA
jgi:hypothetical protein